MSKIIGLNRQDAVSVGGGQVKLTTNAEKINNTQQVMKYIDRGFDALVFGGAIAGVVYLAIRPSNLW